MVKMRLSGVLLVMAALAVGVWQLVNVGGVLAQSRGESLEVPTFQADPAWPKPLPNHWIVGAVIGVAVDAKDNIWITHRATVLTDFEKAATFNPPRAECCIP